MEKDSHVISVEKMSVEQRVSLLKEMFGEDIASVHFCYKRDCEDMEENVFLLDEGDARNIPALLGRVFGKEMDVRGFELVSSLNEDNEITIGLFNGSTVCSNQEGELVNYDFEFFYKESNGLSITRYISEQNQAGSMKRALDIEEMSINGVDCYDSDCKELFSEIVNVSISGLFSSSL